MSPRWETSYYLRGLFSRALEGPKGWRDASPKILARGVHCPSITLPQLRIFRRRGAVRSEIFDSQMAVVPSSPFRFHPPFSPSRRPKPASFASVGRIASFSLSSLNRITELFFQALWTESEAVYSHVMERRLPEISGLLSLPLRIRLLARAMISLVQREDLIESSSIR